MSPATLALFLQAVALVETGGDARKVGRAGERGAYQMIPAVVEAQGGYGTREAEKEVRKRERILMHAGVEPLPFNVYLAWNAGVGAVLRGEVPVVTYQRAVRVQDLMERLKAEEAAR